MDWSLVLASQGLPATIQGDDSVQGWQLLVPVEHYGAALRALRQFRMENRAQLWRHPLAAAGLIFDWRAAAWFLAFAVVYLLQQSHHPVLSASGMMDNQAVGSGQWWRLFTAVSLHADPGHLIANVTTGILLLGLAMGSFGFGWSALAAYLAGVGGNLTGLILYSGAHLSLGASGMVMGALGMLTVEPFMALRTEAGPKRLAFRGLMGGVLLLVLTGFSPGTDILAHVGGFAWGAVLGLVLQRLTDAQRDSIMLNRAAEILCAALMGFTWWMALR
jgi:membrane associated rhomboid family serine protease